MYEGFALIKMGLSMGVFHALCSPDHVAALVTLSANIGHCYAFSYGIRWGVGHSIGLVTVASSLIMISQGENVEVPENVDVILQSCVGIFMIFLGSYGLYCAIGKRKNISRYLDVDGDVTFLHTIEKNKKRELDRMFTLDLNSNKSSNEHESDNSLSTCSAELGELDDEEEAEANKYRSGLDIKFDHQPHVFAKKKSLNKTWAILIGIVHGIAGPGGVLGVIPAVQLHQWELSMIYLGSFCLSSTITMGIFAALYGIFSERVSSSSKRTNFAFQISCFSSSISIAVGIMWLVLIYMGTLEEIFP